MATKKPGDLFAQLAEEAIRKAYEENLLNQFCDYADKIVMDAVANKGYTGFTGNTQTSYTMGVYQYGELKHVACALNGQDMPIRLKVKRKEMCYLEEPYEGGPRGGIGVTDVTNEFGYQTALRIVKDWNAPRQYPIYMVLTTGTEYSEYIHYVHHMDVLENTRYQIFDELISHIKPIIK